MLIYGILKFLVSVVVVKLWYFVVCVVLFSLRNDWVFLTRVVTDPTLHHCQPRVTVVPRPRRGGTVGNIWTTDYLLSGRSSAALCCLAAHTSSCVTSCNWLG